MEMLLWCKYSMYIHVVHTSDFDAVCSSVSARVRPIGLSVRASSFSLIARGLICVLSIPLFLFFQLSFILASESLVFESACVVPVFRHFMVLAQQTCLDA